MGKEIYLLIVGVCTLVFSVTYLVSNPVKEEILYTGTVRCIEVYGRYDANFLIEFEDGRVVQLFFNHNIYFIPREGDILIEKGLFSAAGNQITIVWEKE